MSLKKLLQRYLPKPDDVKRDSNLGRVRKYLFDPRLWYLNRHSVARGAAIGLFVAFIPLPVQMLTAAIFAILLRANLLIAVALTWITNPFTFVPINYFIFKVGQWVTNDTSTYHIIQEFEWHSKNGNLIGGLLIWLKEVGKPFLVGLPIVAICASITGFVLVQFIWRLVILFYLWRKRMSTRRIK